MSQVRILPGLPTSHRLLTPATIDQPKSPQNASSLVCECDQRPAPSAPFRAKAAFWPKCLWKRLIVVSLEVRRPRPDHQGRVAKQIRGRAVTPVVSVRRATDDRPGSDPVELLVPVGRYTLAQTSYQAAAQAATAVEQLSLPKIRSELDWLAG